MTMFALVLLITTSAGADPILFRAANAPDLEYRARVRADEAFRTPTEAYVSQHPTAAARDLLLARFARAQAAFLDHSTGEARRHFQEVVALLPTDDWAEADRAIFLHAFLRLAQLENGAADRTHWLEQARFLGPVPDVGVDLFPPPLLVQYRSLARGGPRFTPDVRALGWPLILVNGVPCRADACPSFPAAEGSARVTFVSDRWQPRTLHVDLATLGRRSPPRVDWVRGDCGNGGLAPAARELGPGRPFFSLACDARGEKTEALTPEPALVPELAALAAPGASASLDALVTAPEPTARRPFYRSPWVWAGVGAVALGALALVMTHARRTPAPAPGPPVVRSDDEAPVVLGFR